MYFIFNGVDSRDIGLKVKNIIFDVMAKKRITGQVLNKFDGTIYTDEETFESYSLDIECTLRDNFELSNILKVKNMFKGGKGELKLSHKPGRIFKAIVSNNINFVEMLNKTGSCLISFMVEPFALLESGGSYVAVTNNMKLNNPGNYKSFPLIKVSSTGSFNISFNGRVMKFINVTKPFIVDTELEDIYGLDGANLNNYLDISSDFQFLDEGENTIVLSGISNIEIKPNWREL